MKEILVFGNPLVKEDNLAIEIAKELKIPDVKFVICDSFSDILNYNKKEITILDIIENIDKVIIFKDIEKLKINKFTAHDFDLAFNLKLMKKMGKINNITIIGIPQKGDKEKIKKEIIRFINK